MLKVFGVQILMLAVFGSCATSRIIVAGLSSDIQSRYDIYPSIEVDIAAVTDDEAGQVKTAGVDGYFSPDNPLRKRLEPFTSYFSEEFTAPRELRTWTVTGRNSRKKGRHGRLPSPVYRIQMDSYWQEWQKKKPSQLLVIADLPHSTDMPKDDPRIILIDLKKTLFAPSYIYIEVDPDKIVRVYKRPEDPRAASIPAAKTDNSK
ncbi:MAG: hypothetical protein LBB22_06115 [Treponema sp.]|jgi:hypothetical protein|nr:hypothetical protein [Treponema sp.]